MSRKLVPVLAYDMSLDTYTCDVCGIEMKFGEVDEVRGDMWGCEICGDAFCAQCFVDALGYKRYKRMLQEDNQIRCPSCYKDYYGDDSDEEGIDV